MLATKNPHPIIAWLNAIKNAFKTPSKTLALIFFIISISLVFSTYTYLKTIIPDVNYFYSDNTLSYIDSYIHFGSTPWKITHGLFKHAIFTLIFDLNYKFWFIVTWASLLYFIVHRENNTLRNQFILTFIFCWLIIGTFMATLFSSSGPCFVHLINQSSDYLPLLDKLNTQNRELISLGLPMLSSLEIQNNLWLMYENRQQGIGSGISAMPSMHVSMAVLLALAVSTLHRQWGILAWCYALMIQIGSVHLAWHYAIDGYVSALVTVIIWQTMGWLMKRTTPSS
ncbi:phosphatase PAP2 family protein [Vibrio sp. Vf1514]|uniref:phosphatase PAP2 family protein n=1 Tax=Vibrio sp. Vf1514 TaxID=3437381 RepID=UPI003F8CD0F0